MKNRVEPNIDPGGKLLVTGLQLNNTELNCSASFHITSLSAHLACASSDSLWGFLGRECQKPYWAQSKQYPWLSSLIKPGISLSKVIRLVKCDSLCESTLTTPNHLLVLRAVSTRLFSSPICSLVQTLAISREFSNSWLLPFKGTWCHLVLLICFASEIHLHSP